LLFTASNVASECREGLLQIGTVLAGIDVIDGTLMLVGGVYQFVGSEEQFPTVLELVLWSNVCLYACGGEGSLCAPFKLPQNG